MSAKLSRRDFLRLSSLTLLGLPFKPLPPDDQDTPIFYGRVIFVYLTVYSRPSVYGQTRALYDFETVLPIYAEVEGEDEGAYNNKWYQTRGGYIHSTNVQPVAIQPNPPALISRPVLGEITLPYADSYATPGYSREIVHRLYYSSVHWIVGSKTDATGRLWYELLNDRGRDNYYIPATSARLVRPEELKPISPDVADKAIRIDTTAQTITAFEAGRAVKFARTSSGGVFGIGKDFRTPLGDYTIERKRPSRHMAAGDLAADDSYDLPGVPWVNYFNGGIAIHGTYWHNDYGRAWSHGCINVSPSDAKWFYRWTLPVASADQRLVESQGTPVIVV
jgi:hypothetical protein